MLIFGLETVLEFWKGSGWNGTNMDDCDVRNGTTTQLHTPLHYFYSRRLNGLNCIQLYELVSLRITLVAMFTVPEDLKIRGTTTTCQ